MHAASNFTSHDPGGQDSLSTQIKQRIHNAASNPAALTAITSEGPFFRQDKKAVVFREWLDSVNGWTEKLPADTFKESGTGVNTRLVVAWKGR